VENRLSFPLESGFDCDANVRAEKLVGRKGEKGRKAAYRRVRASPWDSSRAHMVEVKDSTTCTREWSEKGEKGNARGVEKLLQWLATMNLCIVHDESPGWRTIASHAREWKERKMSGKEEGNKVKDVRAYGQ
jgi:hypothetical protein